MMNGIYFIFYVNPLNILMNGIYFIFFVNPF